jgi:hypothetical protein
MGLHTIIDSNLLALFLPRCLDHLLQFINWRFQAEQKLNDGCLVKIHCLGRIEGDIAEGQVCENPVDSA